MKYIIKFSCVGLKHTTEFMDFDPFKLDSESINDLCYMLMKTENALKNIAVYRNIFEEMEKSNVLEI